MIKNKSGFTLTELLAVVAIMSVVALIAVPSVILVSKSIKQRLYDSKVELLVSAAELYLQDNNSYYGVDNTNVVACSTTGSVGDDEACVQVSDLIKSGYAEVDAKYNEESCVEEIGCIYSPIDNSLMNNEWILIKTKNSGGTVGIWNGIPSSSSYSEDDTLLSVVCSTILSNSSGSKLGRNGLSDTNTCNCSDLTSYGSGCLVVGEDLDNWVKYPNGTESDYDWRIVGVYCINSSGCTPSASENTGLSVKMLTNNNIFLK